jgi:hypothetical protein
LALATEPIDESAGYRHSADAEGQARRTDGEERPGGGAARAAGDPSPGRVRRQDHPRRDEAVHHSGTRGAQAGVARRVRQVAVTPLVINRQADARLLLSIQRERRLVGMAAMAGVDAIDRRTPISLQPEQRADAIHDSQDTKSPAGKTDGADV